MSSSDSAEDNNDLLAAKQPRSSRCPAWVPSAVSNFTIQFNFASASMAGLFMKSASDVPVANEFADYPEPHWVHTVMKSSVFIGSIVGMLVMGRLGDSVGIKRALILTNSLVVVTALASGLLVWGPPNILYALLVLWRFLLGVGVGGNYPLAAAKASSVGTVEEAVTKAGRAFFWQGPGSVAPYAVGYLLLLIPPFKGITSLQFRLVMALGAIPSAFVVYFMTKEPDDKPSDERKKTVREASGRKPTTASGATSRREDSHEQEVKRGLARTLVGTAGTWLFFDIAYYGMNIFAPTILKSIFPPGAPLATIAIRAAILPICGIAGTLIGIPLLGVIGPRILNAAGLLIAAFLYILFVYMQQHNAGSSALFTILCSLFFVLKGAPDIATYVLPVMSFPRSVRATYHGRSGSAGKVGAMLGTFIFPLLFDSGGLQLVFVIEAVACIVSAAFGLFLVSPLELDDEVVSNTGQTLTVRNIDQDELESDEALQAQIYDPMSVHMTETKESINEMKEEIALLHHKIDLLLAGRGLAAAPPTFTPASGPVIVNTNGSRQ
eukprot:TRINITY_DN2625_c0_g1_i12.p1 TRINITY_DN2625_c0_g1~~TRINITY_DN2625_c0_g1_i12.p1  ORF type:complete len:551 (-),score=90.01 TRINITY_DN2625_c0_g1_i12:51-1703(-)